ncbi:unnamed protein product [Phytophthora fragariaefolia]|uniref:Unnamed protein product n=1 Tax=Phytophthora fragariaefolia TaxID=1490495 RepID=A0A9W6TSW8_9STRA|nr:unnamed protein product [Phytophthora fragariaefolia]
MRSVPCRILPGDGDEFLLGRDALKALGIDVEHQLAQLAGQPTLTDEAYEFPVGDAIPEVQEVPSVDDAVEHLVRRHVTLQADGVPHRSAPRRCAPLQAQFVREYVGLLVANGLVEKNNASRWASAVVPVSKPGSRDQFRLTIDYRLVNRVTVSIAGSMPTSATTTDAFAGKKLFASFDFTQGF